MASLYKCCEKMADMVNGNNNFHEQANSGFQYLMQHSITSSLELGDQLPIAASIEETRPQQAQDYSVQLLFPNNEMEQANNGFQYLMQHSITSSLELGDQPPIEAGIEETRPQQAQDYFVQLLFTNNEMEQANNGFQHLMQHLITSSLELGDQLPIAASIEETRPQQAQDCFVQLLFTDNEMAAAQL